MKSPIQIVENTFGHPFEHLLYNVGTRARIPWPVLRAIDEVVDFSRAPGDFISRRRLAGELLKDAPTTRKFTRDTGYCLLGPGEISETEAMVRDARSIWQERRGQIAGESEKEVPFHTGVLRPEMVTSTPSFLDFALSPALLSILADYFGTIPRLCGVDFMFTEASREKAIGSQLWHLDKPETNWVQCFVALDPISHENGPFTFYPANITDEICGKTDYIRRSTLGDGRLGDDEVMEACGGAEPMTFRGDRASIALVDTSRCLHFGSRLRSGHRLMIAFRYAPAHRVYASESRNYDRSVAGDDPLKLKVLSGGFPVPKFFGKQRVDYGT